MAILFSFAACNNSSSSSGDDAGDNPQTPPGSSGGLNSGSLEDTSHSVSEGNRLSEEYFDVKSCDDGIYLECDVPGGTTQFRVYIDGIGLVAEDLRCNENRSRGYFFYPFLTPEKKYTISFVFLREEDFDEDGYCLGHAYGNDAIAWFETEATAGKNSKGEVRIKDFGEIEVGDNGDFKFTKKLTFENEQLLTGSGYDWTLGIGISEGRSWLWPDRRSKWLTEIQIPNKEILNRPYNFYTYPRTYGDVTKADFIVWRPRLSYTYKGEVYPYQWDGYTLDTNCKAYSELTTNIDIKKDEDVKKLQGTWTRKNEWDDYRYGILYHCVYTDSLTFAGKNVTTNEFWTYTKRDGASFTKEELFDMAGYENETTMDAYMADEYEKQLEDDEKVLYFEKEELTSDDSETRYKYTVYRLYGDYAVSSDGKTLTRKYESSESAVSEYFADHSESYGYSEHYDLKIFDGVLKIIHSEKYSNGDYSEDVIDYQKQ